jgi:hypothetical protein
MNLDPEGQPIQIGQTPEQVQQLVDRARALSEAGDAPSAFQTLAVAFQTDVVGDNVIEMACELLQRNSETTGTPPGDEFLLFDQIRRDRNDFGAYHRLGTHFLRLGQFGLARPFLEQARALAVDEPQDVQTAIDVDKAQTLVHLGEYEEAINAFHTLNEKVGGLPLGLILLMCECYALMRLPDEAEAVYQVAPAEAAAQIQGLDREREETGDLLARLRDFDGVEELDLPAWHYIQTRGMLLETNPDPKMPGGRFVLYQPSEEDVAYLVGLTAALLDAREYSPTRIVWLGPSAEPLARLFAQWWEVEENSIRPYRSGDNSDSEEELTLLVMAHSNEIREEQTYQELLPARAGMIIFALDLRWTEAQPITPDISGFMSQACNLPWETRIEPNEDGNSWRQVTETRDPATIAEAIASQFPPEEECDEFANETLETFERCTDLILEHRDGTLNRRPLMTHSPIKSAKLGL